MDKKGQQAKSSFTKYGIQLLDKQNSAYGVHTT
jgi:hypothetical protein